MIGPPIEIDLAGYLSERAVVVSTVFTTKCPLAYARLQSMKLWSFYHRMVLPLIRHAGEGRHPGE